MQQKQTGLKSPRLIVHEITKSNQFLENARKMRTRPEKVRLVSSLALSESGVSDESAVIPRATHDSDHFLTKDEASMRLFGRIESFIASQIELDYIRDDKQFHGKHTPYSEKMPHLLNVIRFNHAVSDILDSYPEISEQDIERFVIETMIICRHDQTTIAYARRSVREAMWGMNQENAVEQALYECDDVDTVEKPTEEQELVGIDRVIIFTDGDTLPIDVKASQIRAQRAVEHGSRSNIVVSPFTPEDFKDRRVTKTAMQRKLPAVKASIQALHRNSVSLVKTA